MTEIHVKLFSAANSRSLLVIYEWQLQLLRQLNVYCALSRASINQCINKLRRGRARVGSLYCLLYFRGVRMKKTGVESNFNSDGRSL